jgi:peptidylprolyl isomerase
LEAYEKAKAAHTIEAYQEYLRLRPKGFFAESARKALNDLGAAQTAQRSAEEDDLDWRMAQTADTESAYRYYLDTWPNGRHRHEAQAALGSEQLFLSENKKRPGVITTSSGLQYEVLKKGNGTGAPKATDKVTVHYHGTLIDGTVFDSSVNRGQTATFGLNQVIPGWTEGLQLMRVGDKFRFYMPANLAYGNRSPSAKIKPNSMLIFDVELFSIGQ